MNSVCFNYLRCWLSRFPKRDTTIVEFDITNHNIKLPPSCAHHELVIKVECTTVSLELTDQLC